MADGKVTLTLTPVEYRLLRSELEAHTQNLLEERKLLQGKPKQDVIKREAGIKFLLEKI